jgi:hypothetical protein
MRVTPRATARGWPFFHNNTNREERTHGDEDQGQSVWDRP